MSNKANIIFLFSGQGSQYRGMGRILYEQNHIFSSCIKECDQIVRKLLNRSLIDELYHIEDKDFSDLLITHPAIVAVEIAMFRVLEAINIKPDLVVGTSLGEFAAGVACGFWDLDKAISAAAEQAKLIAKNVARGGMISVTNSFSCEIESIYAKHNLILASENFKKHFTIAGLASDLDSCEITFKKAGIDYVRLPIDYPFHTNLMDACENECFYHSFNVFNPSKQLTGFISGLRSDKMEILPENYFWQAVGKYFDFSKLIGYTESLGTAIYVDLGPSGTAATFTKYNLDPLSESFSIQIMTPFRTELRQLEELQRTLS